MDMTRYILLQANLLPSFWTEAVNAACYIRNRCSTSTLDGAIPYEKWFGTTVDLTNLRKLGTRTFVLDKSPKRNKFDPRSREGILIGYSMESIGYRIWIPSENKVVVTRDAKFINEDTIKEKFLEATKEIRKKSRETEILDIDLGITDEEPSKESSNSSPLSITVTRHSSSENPLIRASGRPRLVRSGERGRPRKLYKMRTGNSAVSDDEVESNVDVNELQDDVFEYAGIAKISIGDALKSDEREEWKDVIYSEIKSLVKSDVFEIIKRSNDDNLVVDLYEQARTRL